MCRRLPKDETLELPKGYQGCCPALWKLTINAEWDSYVEGDVAVGTVLTDVLVAQVRRARQASAAVPLRVATATGTGAERLQGCLVRDFVSTCD